MTAPIDSETTPSEAGRHDREHRGVFAAVRTVASLTLLSRIGGLLRDMTTARVFGDSAVASAFHIAFFIPNLFRRLFGEGALAAAFIPEYARLDAESRDAAGRFAWMTLSLVLIATGLLTLLGEAALAAGLALADHPPERLLMLRLAMLLLPYMPMVCVAAVLGGMLQVHGRFGVAAAAPVLLNVAMIAGAAVGVGTSASPERSAFLVGVGAVAAGVLQSAWCLLALRGRVRWRAGGEAVLASARASYRRMLERFMPAVLGMGTLQLNQFIDAAIAVWPLAVGPLFFGLVYPLDEASMGILSYTQRLYQFPLGVFGIAVATAVFPALSRASGDPALFAAMLRRGLRLSLFIGLPASAGLFVVRHDLCAALLQGGQFSQAGVDRSALILMGYAPAVWAYSANHTLVRAFYARGDTVTPLRIALIAVAVNFLGNATLIWVPGMGEAGLAWSTAIAATVQFILLGRSARRLLGAAPLLTRHDVAAIARLVAMSAVMLAVVWAVGLALPDGDAWSAAALRLGALTIVGAAVYAALALVAGAPELRWLLSRRAPTAAEAEQEARDIGSVGGGN